MCQVNFCSNIYTCLYNIFYDIENIGSAKLEEPEVDCSFPSEKGSKELSLKPSPAKRNIRSSSNVDKGPIPAYELEASAACTSTDQSYGMIGK